MGRGPYTQATEKERILIHLAVPAAVTKWPETFYPSHRKPVRTSPVFQLFWEKRSHTFRAKYKI